MWASFFSEVHELLGYTLIAAVSLHLAGALKHHLIDKDGTLRRMLGASVDVQRS
jgi:cytochrome b561